MFTTIVDWLNKRFSFYEQNLCDARKWGGVGQAVEFC